jgi:hypothetical protein
MNPSSNNHPSSDTIYQDTLITPHAKCIPEKLKSIGNLSYVRTIFKTVHIFRRILIKTGPVKDAQQTKQCVSNVPHDCGVVIWKEQTGL